MLTLDLAFEFIGSRLSLLKYRLPFPAAGSIVLASPGCGLRRLLIQIDQQHRRVPLLCPVVLFPNSLQKLQYCSSAIPDDISHAVGSESWICEAAVSIDLFVENVLDS
ncbi:hypothetical protein H9L39_18761 [Fusarium oxysporum f. sp. albedinis]|nr:hypothetical protein H9L39_18761 [Fusarium oxysporum f. sp. albedinis]